MTDLKYEARLAVLADWAESAAARGYAVPRRADLEAVSLAKSAAAAEANQTAVEPWIPTITWLLKQAAFGVAAPHLQLPAELAVPLGFVPNADENEATPEAAPAEEVAMVSASTFDAVSGASTAATVDVTLVDVSSGAPTDDSPAEITVVAKIKPAAAPAKGPKWEAEAHADVKAAVKKFAKPLQDLLTRDANEGDTRLLITDMLCEGLGYDKFRDLTTEYMVKQDFADYGVRIDKQLVAFIEVKRVSQKLNERHLRQVQMYAVNEGVEWMILTNGQVWRAYHLTGGLPVIVNLAFEVDLLGPDSLEGKAEKMFFLHREALKRRRIDELWKHRAATAPDALLDIILSDTVLETIRKEVKRNTGIATTAQAVAEVIRNEIVDRKLLTI